VLDRGGRSGVEAHGPLGAGRMKFLLDRDLHQYLVERRQALADELTALAGLVDAGPRRG